MVYACVTILQPQSNSKKRRKNLKLNWQHLTDFWLIQFNVIFALHSTFARWDLCVCFACFVKSFCQSPPPACTLWHNSNGVLWTTSFCTQCRHVTVKMPLAWNLVPIKFTRCHFDENVEKLKSCLRAVFRQKKIASFQRLDWRHHLKWCRKSTTTAAAADCFSFDIFLRNVIIASVSQFDWSGTRRFEYVFKCVSWTISRIV